MSASTLKLNPAIAKFASNGQITCLICTMQVKPKIWTAHVNGKKHRDSAARLKQQLLSGPAQATSLKRDASAPTNEPPSKRPRDDMPTQPSTSNGGLPADFFEASSGSTSQMDTVTPWQKGREMERDAQKQRSGIIEGVPQGFFDDERNDRVLETVEKKEQMDAEYERFMREVNAQNLEEMRKQEEEEQQEFLQRDLDNYDEQMQVWQRAHELELEVEAKAANKAPKRQDEDSDNDEELVLDLSNWRSKTFI